MNSMTQSATDQDKEHEYHYNLSSACGYLELQMDVEAWAELDKLSPTQQLRAPVMKIRWYLLMRRNLYQAASRVARAGSVLHPADPSFFVLTAYAYEKQDDLVHALDVWEGAPSQIRESAFAHYQSARYAALLGRTDNAREHLHQAIQREPQYTFTAECDSILCPLVHES